MTKNDRNWNRMRDMRAKGSADSPGKDAETNPLEDWRLRGQEAYLDQAVLRRAVFPEFWQEAYKKRNPFYQKVSLYAQQFVATMQRGDECLDGEQIQHFWHAHCDFCLEKALTDKPCEFYYTEDMDHWICAECFQNFREQFHWQLEDTGEACSQRNTP